MRPLWVQEPLAVFYFVVVTSIAVFILMNIFTSVIVENAFKSAKADQKDLTRHLQAEKELQLEALRGLFDAMDLDNSGKVDVVELQMAVKKKAIRDKLKALNIGPKDLKEIWDILDDGRGELDIEEFINGMRRVQGECKAKDL